MDRLDKILFSCYVRILFPLRSWSCDMLWAFTALRPPAPGWPITLLTQPSRAQSSVVPAALVEHLTGQQEREPGSFSLLQANGPERKERQGKGSHREGLLLSQSRGLQGKAGL